ncbi:MAG: hypothetical protein R2685_07765 [Candidatus Nitrosocosmicus sp.]|nr:hypothetical protein [Candidatus Nitrosocosmicus sp.]
MTNSNKSNKLVNTGNKENKKRNWSETYSRVVADIKTVAKFKKQIKKHNKGLDNKDKKISQVGAATEALKLWMEKNE